VESAEESGREKFRFEFGNEPWREGGGGKETTVLVDRFAIDGPARTVEQKGNKARGLSVRTRPVGGGGRALVI